VDVFRNASATGSGLMNFQIVSSNGKDEEGLIRDIVDEKAWVIISGV
jgi:hypothetical protein